MYIIFDRFPSCTLHCADQCDILHIVCRSLIHPHDIVKFDELISPHEMRALQKKAPESEDSSDTVSIEYEYSDRDIDDGSENDNYRQEEQNSQDPVGGANILMETQSNGKYCDYSGLTINIILH